MSVLIYAVFLCGWLSNSQCQMFDPQTMVYPSSDECDHQIDFMHQSGYAIEPHGDGQIYVTCMHRRVDLWSDAPQGFVRYPGS